MNRVGIRVQDLFDEHILRQKVEAALSLKNQVLVKIYNRRAVEVDEVVEELLGYAERLRPMVADTSLAARAGAGCRGERAARGRPGHAARRRPRHLPVRDVVVARPPAARAPGRASRRRGSTRVIAILKAYTTRVGEGPFPTELFDDDGEYAAQDRRRVRHHHRAAAPLRLDRHRHRPLRQPDQRRHRLRHHQARRAHRVREGAGVRGLRGRRRAARRDAGEPDATSTTRSRSTSCSPAGGRTSPGAATFDDLPAAPRPTCCASRS